ncbi:MAG: ACT domain-containing protein [Candidatus Anstonellales archaeon]
MVKTIVLVENDRIGLLNDISYIMGKEKINIENIVGHTVGKKAIISMTVKDFKKAMQVLKKNGFNVMSEDSIMIKLKDRPGELSKITELLAKNKINIKNLYVVSRDGINTLISLSVNKKRKAEKILSPYRIQDL